MLTRDRLLLFLWFLLFRFLRGSLCSPRPPPAPPQLLLLSRPGRLLSHPRGAPTGGAGPQPPPAAGPRHAGSPGVQRVKRGWVWNQFFVLEEYMGMEPLYIGKVSRLPNACTCARTHTHTRAWTSARRNTSRARTHTHMSMDQRTQKHLRHTQTQTHTHALAQTCTHRNTSHTNRPT